MGGERGRAATGRPRIVPGGRAEIGRVTHALSRMAGAAVGSGPLNLLTTLGRHRRLFRPWLRFAGRLMPGGVLPRADSELVILRVAHNTGCEYEWRHHERLARTVGLGAADVERVRDGARAEGWSPRQALLLRAADELHDERTISDPLWQELRALLSDVELIELCMLVGHYEMIAGLINSLGIEEDVHR